MTLIQRLASCVFVLFALAALASPLLAQGGPPLITDDPDTPGPRHWEINLSYFRQHSHEERLSEEPRLDLNYGVGRRIQLKLEGPWLVRLPQGGQALRGLGSTVAGVKWRFLGEESRRIAWSVYPQYEFDMSPSSASKGLTEDGRVLLLPTEITLEVKPIELNLEVGRNFVSRGPDEWVYGLATEASVGRRLELVGEVHGQTAAGSPTELIINAGGRERITSRLTLMAALGRAVRGQPAERPSLLVYAGVQLLLPRVFDFSAPAR